MDMRKFYVVLVFLCVANIVRTSLADSVSLTWDSHPDTNVAGYLIGWRTAPSTNPVPSTNYPYLMDAGNNLRAEITITQQTEIVFFALCAYNTAGLEGEWSDEVYFNPVRPEPPSAPTNFVLALSYPPSEN